MRRDKVCLPDGPALGYTVDRSRRRRNLYLAIGDGGALTVRAPYGVSDEEIRRIVAGKYAWIKRKQDMLRRSEVGASLRDGSKVMVFGAEKTVCVRNDRPAGVSGDALVVHAPDGEVEAEVRRCLYSMLSDYLKDSFDRWSKITSLCPSKITVREMKTRWGSCSAKGSVSINTRLAAYPPRVVDSVVVHELCHLRYLNHSQNFWTLLYGFFPDYDKCRRVLLGKNGTPGDGGDV